MAEIYSWNEQVAGVSGYGALVAEMYTSDGSTAVEGYVYDGAASQQAFPLSLTAPPDPSSSDGTIYYNYTWPYQAEEGVPATGDAAADGWTGAGFDSGLVIRRASGPEVTNSNYFRDSWGRQNLFAVSWDRYTQTGTFVDTYYSYNPMGYRLDWGETDGTTEASKDELGYNHLRKDDGPGFPFLDGMWGFEYDEVWAYGAVSGPRFHYMSSDYTLLATYTEVVTEASDWRVLMGYFPENSEKLRGSEAGTDFSISLDDNEYRDNLMSVVRYPAEHGGEETEEWIRRVGRPFVTVTRDDYDPGNEQLFTGQMYTYYQLYPERAYYKMRILPQWNFSPTTQNATTIQQGETLTFKFYKQAWGA